MRLPPQRPSRVVIEPVAPLVDGGAFPAKATAGEPVTVRADVFADGHDRAAAALRYRAGRRQWTEIPMTPVGNDRFTATFVPQQLGRWELQIHGWLDHLGTWRHGLELKQEAGVDVTVDLEIGARLVEGAIAAGPSARDRQALLTLVTQLRDGDATAVARRAAHAADDAPTGHVPDLDDTEPGEHDDVDELFWRAGVREPRAELAAALRLDVDHPRARFSSWYEFFPRSTIAPAAGHATLTDALSRLDAVAAMGFDVLYLPPIHPIGMTYRKGRNNTVTATADDVGSPWAIGGPEGGHVAVHPELGTLDDVDRLVAACGERGIALALDLAFQCTPDHPWVTEHPDWFAHRPDGTIQYAENPPKKYQDIYPLDFESADWANLWRALNDVVRFWIGHGITVFRVDNPHTKAFAFWEWMIADVRHDHPEVIFLAEAFTRPRVMGRLGKIGFNQSYTYFTWRQSSWELREYGLELAQQTVDYFRPNFWPNTPDILTEQLATGGPAMFASRAFLAATLSPSWGIYGPAFELMEHVQRPGAEEYIDNEKFELRQWDMTRPSIVPLITALNRVRRDQPALQHLRTLRFHGSDNPALLVYSKSDPAGIGAPLLIVANLDADRHQGGTIDVDLKPLGLPYDVTYDVVDVLTGDRARWHGSHNWIGLEPERRPGRIFRLEQV